MIPRHIDELFSSFELGEFSRTVFETDVWFGQLAHRELARLLWCDGLEIEDALLRSGARLDREDVRIVRDGALLERGSLAKDRRTPLREEDAPELYDVVRAGQTLAVTLNPPRRGPIGAIVALMEEAFRCSSHAVVYVTPPGARGFDLHHDEDDVFVIQLDGSKLWRWAPPTIRWPLESSYHPQENVEGLRDAHLRTADVLYLPRGTIHAAETTSDHSVHLTMSISRPRVFQRDLEACLVALGERAERELPPCIWDDPSREASLVAELAAVLEPLELRVAPFEARRDPDRFWLDRALRGAR